ncbi:MAG: hypothetical protein ACI95S_000342 [Dinoroseobacter sp.]|jgi:hypothetical protein
MMMQVFSRRPGLAAILLGLVASGLYLLMITVTLPAIEAISGQIPFDMRPLGYSPLEAAQVLEGLGAQGRAYYLTYQIPLDTLYPGIMALTLMATIVWLRARVPYRKLAFAGLICAVAAAIADYSENLGIVLMIHSGPNLSDALVHFASFSSVVKALSTTASVLTCVGLAVIWVARLAGPARA